MFPSLRPCLIGLVSVAAVMANWGEAFGQPVKAIVAGRLPIGVGDRRIEIPFISNVPLDQKNARIDRAVIVIHGIGRDADVYFETMMKAAGLTANSQSRTIIVAPQFLNHEDAAAHSFSETLAVWPGSSWAEGYEGRTKAEGKKGGISSYAVIDRLVENLVDERVFPKLRRVVIVGHSAGGQFVNRYAAGNSVDAKLSGEGKIRMRYIVANPSSYLYFNDERPVAGSPGKFAKPTAEQAKECNGYNHYRYGLDKLNPYMAATGPDKLRSQYAQREVYYLLGSADNDPNHSTLSRTCAAQMQGRHRLERGQLYHAYLRHFFGPEIAKRHRVQLVPGVGHSSRQMFHSLIGVRCIFEATARRAN